MNEVAILNSQIHRINYIWHEALQFFQWVFFFVNARIKYRNRIIRADIGNFDRAEMDGKWIILTVLHALAEQVFKIRMILHRDNRLASKAGALSNLEAI